MGEPPFGCIFLPELLKPQIARMQLMAIFWHYKSRKFNSEELVKGFTKS